MSMCSTNYLPNQSDRTPPLPLLFAGTLFRSKFDLPSAEIHPITHQVGGLSPKQDEPAPSSYLPN